MKLPVVCPHCETEYQLDSGLQGKKIRCLNSLCQEIFLVEGSKKPEVKKDLPKQKPPEKVTSAPPKASSVEQILPLVSAQQADSPENSPADSPSEAYTQPPPPVRGARVQESEPKAESPPPKKEKPEQDTSYDQPPPVRTNVENSSVSSPEQGTEAPSEEAPPEEVTEDGPEDLDAWLMSAEESSPIKKEESLSETLPGKPPDPPPVRSATATEEEGSSEDWQAPPVRTSITDGEMSAKPDSPPEEFAVPKASGAGTRNLLIILALLILAGGGVGLGIWMVQGGKADAEQKRWLAAKEKYDQRSFEEAAAMFHQLNLDFPDSPKGDLYHFLSGLSEVRGKVEVVHNELDLLFIALDQFGTFLKTQQGVPFMEEYQGDIWTSLQHAIEQLTFRAEEKRDRDLMKKAKALVKKAAQYDPPPQKLAVVRARLKDVEEVIVFAEEKKKLETQLKNLIEHPEGNVPKIKDEIVSPYLDTHPKLAMEPEIRQLLAKIPEAHRKAVTFQAHNDPPLPLKKSGHITNIFVQDSKRENSLSLMDHQVALAQARGVLYGMDPHNGKLLWAYRVGLDNEAPPLRIPATPIWNERLLVLSSDRYTVSALEAESGREIWKQQLTSPCLGRPVLLKDRIFLALYEGKVDEIEINGGRRLGSYRMGQNLTGWGVREPSSYRLYFPAQENCLFVLDVAEQKCVHILYTKHPMGSMDGQPVLLEGKKKLLLLKQTKGLDKTHLRIFPLPMPAEEMPPIAMLGWLWFTPYVEDDRLSFVSDAGEFFAFGIGQTGSRDDPLFPLFRRKILRGRRQSIPRPRGQVFHADANKFWLMVHGNIQQVSHGFFRQSGPKLLSSRFEPVFIGNPTQNGRTQRTESGEPLFFLVTQKDENHLALLVGPKSGRTLWQTKLGLVCNKPPITVGTKKLIIEQDGRQFLLDTKKELPNKSSWVSGQEIISEILPAPFPVLHVYPQGKRVSLLMGDLAQDKGHYVFRRLSGEKKTKVQDQKFTLPGIHRGLPAIATDCVLFPLDNGILVRQGLNEKEGNRHFAGPNWRASHADPDSPGYVVSLDSAEYLFTDGSRGIRQIRWQKGNSWELIDQIDLERRLISPPILFPRGEEQRLQIVVADADNVVTLLNANPLQVVKRWKLPGKITEYPFIRGNRIGSIVDHKTIVWLDPAQEMPLWQRHFSYRLIGEPQEIDDEIIVADENGRIRALDPATGKNNGQEIILPGFVTVTTSPVAWDEDQLLAPLTDGTLALIHLGKEP